MLEAAKEQHSIDDAHLLNYDVKDFPYEKYKGRFGFLYGQWVLTYISDGILEKFMSGIINMARRTYEQPAFVAFIEEMVEDAEDADVLDIYQHPKYPRS